MGAGSRLPDRGPTVIEAVAAWSAAADAGQARQRGGHPFGRRTLVAYRQRLLQYVVPVLGSRRLAEVRRTDLQRLIDDLDLDAYSVDGILTALSAVYRWALARDLAQATRSRRRQAA